MPPLAMDKADHYYMARALALAEKGSLTAHPNPMVGCVIVRGARVVGQGYHTHFGGLHAETEALRLAGRNAGGATLYVNLEPCCHWGKQPPCVDAIIQSGVCRVVAAVKDPHGAVQGRGFTCLRKAGIRVDVGVMAAESAHLNRAFVKANTSSLPYVVWKTAQTLDGKIASQTGKSRWITGRAARSLVHRLRAQSDAVVTGGSTVRRDNPSLTSHGAGPNPARIVLSNKLGFSGKARVFSKDAPTLVLTGNDQGNEARGLSKRGVIILKHSLKDGLKNALISMRKIGFNQLLLECGGSLAHAFLAAGLVDEYYGFFAPSFLGGGMAVTALEGTGWRQPRQGPRLRGVEVSRVGDDMLVHGYL